MRECIGKFDQVMSMKLNKSTFVSFKNDLKDIYTNYDDFEDLEEKLDTLTN